MTTTVYANGNTKHSIYMACLDSEGKKIPHKQFEILELKQPYGGVSSSVSEDKQEFYGFSTTSYKDALNKAKEIYQKTVGEKKCTS